MIFMNSVESERKMRDLTDLMDSKEVDYIKSSTELENRSILLIPHR